MAQVTYSNLFSESRARVVALMTSTNVVDPIISSAEYRKWIYSREPDVKNLNFKGYPFLIVHPVDVDLERERTSADGKHKFINFNIEIEIFTSDRGHGENDGKGLTYIDAISNDVLETFLNVSNRNSLLLNGLQMIEPITESVETIPKHNELVYRRSITLQFRGRLKISAWIQ